VFLSSLFLFCATFIFPTVCSIACLCITGPFYRAVTATDEEEDEEGGAWGGADDEREDRDDDEADEVVAVVEKLNEAPDVRVFGI